MSAQLCCGHKGEPVQVPKFEGIVQLHWQLIIVAEAAGVAVPFAVLVHQPVAVPKFEGESGAACLRACSRLSALLQTSHCTSVEPICSATAAPLCSSRVGELRRV